MIHLQGLIEKILKNKFDFNMEGFVSNLHLS